MAVHPKLAAMTGSIDPVFKKGTDDDMTFGMDIYNLFGSQFKKYVPISLVTNPRREIFIVRNILEGNDIDSKKMYEDFNNTLFLYDQDISYYETLVDSIKSNLCHSEKTLLLNQYYQWVWRTIAKNYFSDLAEFKHVDHLCNTHKIGYWERENAFVNIYKSKTDNESINMFERISSEALTEFNKLILSLNLEFSKVTKTINSRLI